MKIKTKELSYDEVMSLPRAAHLKPRRPSPALKRLIKTLADMELKDVEFECNRIGMDNLTGKESCLVLMNHSSFIDLKIAAHLLYPKDFNIVCTSDGFVGKEKLMRSIGCIPTQKFVMDPNLIKDIHYALHKLNNSVLMYPEASYSFDGTATPLPQSLGKCIKVLGAPVLMIKTYGAFSRDPLYNMLQLRKVKVTADYEYLLSPEQIKEMSASEINAVLKEAFTFDNFKWQQDNKVSITEDFRADGLNRVLYKCPHCNFENGMEGQGIHIVCHNCNAKYELDEYGYLKAVNNEGKFNSVPDWFKWERECVKKELIDGDYKLDIPVKIAMMVDRKAIYNVGRGRLVHSGAGFHLTGCDGKIDYFQKPTANYSLYSDYFWYELGDMICIGDNEISYYCFPECEQDVVAKTRIAAEELYKLHHSKKEIS